jgi:hypothetical protein
MQLLIDQIREQFPSITFRADKRFYWSPETGEVVYNHSAHGDTAAWALLHETSHALLSHSTYSNDFQLLEMEVAAWEHAKSLAKKFRLSAMDEDHIQDCLDTYRDWLHKRCLCPKCGIRSFQQNAYSYSCHNCSASWKVTPSRFCRAYRLSSGSETLSSVSY